MLPDCCDIEAIFISEVTFTRPPLGRMIKISMMNKIIQRQRNLFYEFISLYTVPYWFPTCYLSRVAQSGKPFCAIVKITSSFFN